MDDAAGQICFLMAAAGAIVFALMNMAILVCELFREPHTPRLGIPPWDFP